jgi:hypothetical protein
MPRSRLPRLVKKLHLKKAKVTKEDLQRDFWMCETGTGQQVTQLLDSYIMFMIMDLDAQSEQLT